MPTISPFLIMTKLDMNWVFLILVWVQWQVVVFENAWIELKRVLDALFWKLIFKTTHLKLFLTLFMRFQILRLVIGLILKLGTLNSYLVLSLSKRERLLAKSYFNVFDNRLNSLLVIWIECMYISCILLVNTNV